jgi:hypothetical protein
MPRFSRRILALLLSAATLAACADAACAIETWVGSDGEIRVVPGTEGPVLLTPTKPEKPRPHPPQPAAAVKPKPAKAPPHSPVHVATKPAKTKKDQFDRRPTGAVVPQDPDADPQLMAKPQPLPKPLPPRAARPVTIDPGNPVFNVDPSPDTVPKTNEEDEGMDPNGSPDTGNSPQVPGALPTNPAQPNGIQTPANPTNAAKSTIDPMTGERVPVQVAPDATGRLRVVAPVAAPVQPVQPQTPSGITSSVAQAPQPATTPNPRSLLDDPLADPQAAAYDQVGIRVGSFIWRPAIEASVGGSTNVQSSAGGTASSALRLAPELIGQSDWDRHQLGIELRGSFTDYPANPSLYRPTVSATVTGRIDFSDDTRLALKTSYGLDKLPSTSALAAAGTTQAGLQETATASAALTRDVGRFALTLRGEVDRTDFQQTQASSVPRGSLNNTDLIAALRGTYNLSAGVKPFVEIQADARKYDAPSQDTSTTLVSHDTTGGALKSGVTLDFGPLLTGEASTGYGIETPSSHLLQTLRAYTIDENLIWSPTRQTRITFSTVTAIEPSLTSGASGAVSRTVGVKLADDIFRNLTVDLGGSYLDRHYTGITRTENLAEITSGLTWKINPKMQTFVRGTFDSFTSSARTDDFTAATVFAGIRLQQ